MFSIDATIYSTAVIVFIVIGFFWALFYSTHKIGSLYIGSLLKGIILVSIAICLYMIITGGADPNLLVISGIAIVCFSIIPKPPEEWTNSSVKNLIFLWNSHFNGFRVMIHRTHSYDDYQHKLH